MRAPIDSPFSPGADTVPVIWAGRTEQLSDWRNVVRPRRLAGLTERGRTILGEPGTGKSSLVRRITQEAAEHGDWVTPQLRIPSGVDPLKAVSTALLELARQAKLNPARERHIKELLERVTEVSVHGVSLSLRPSGGVEPYTALTELLIEIGRAALRHRDTMMLVHVDEIQNITDHDIRSQLLIALGDALAHEEEAIAPGNYPVRVALPLAVYLTGLPEFADMANTRTGATFSRRFKTDVLNSIAEEDLVYALQPFVRDGWELGNPTGTRITMTADAQQRLVELSCGEPFLFQLAGEGAWYAGTDDIITRADVDAGWMRKAAEAENHVHRLLERLPAREREFLDAMAKLPPNERTLTNIAHAMGLPTSSSAGPTSQRLDLTRGIIQRGKPYTFRNRAVGAYLTSSWPDVSGVDEPQTKENPVI